MIASLATIDANLPVLLLRVAVGVTLSLHGYQKFFKGGRIPGTAGWFDSMGMRPGKTHAVMAATTEIAAGLGFAVGLLTTFAAAGFVGLMLVAGWTVHRGKFFIVANGWEYNFILAVVAVCVAGMGPGQWSLDRALGIDQKFDGVVGLLIAGVGGAAAGIGLLLAAYRPPASSEN